MELAEKVAGFPKDKCDEVRRAIMKRSISGGEAAKKAAQETRDGFVKGCIANGYTEAVANNLYDKILYFAGYGFNKSHAVAYAIDSFWCAWLMTYYEEQWLCSYVEAMSGKPEKKAKAFGEIKKLGYTIVPIDINHAGRGWTALPGKRLMPSFLSCKGVGESALPEVFENRPYTGIENLLWNEDGTWKHSKFNKKALEALIKVGAFDSLDIVGDGKLFSSYHHMHEVVIEHIDEIKKTTKKDPFKGRTRFYELVEELRDEIEPWSKREQAEHMIEVFGSVDVLSLVPKSFLDKFEEKDVPPIDQLEEGDKNIAWFMVIDSKEMKTKAGKKYLGLTVAGPSGKSILLRAWGWDGKRRFNDYAVCIAEVDRNDFGCSTALFKVKDLT
jgi:DNA polymerase-3 subunit alpha